MKGQSYSTLKEDGGDTDQEYRCRRDHFRAICTSGRQLLFDLEDDMRVWTSPRHENITESDRYTIPEEGASLQ